jgi:hypothetical protein
MSINRLPGLYDSESVKGWRLIKAVIFLFIGGSFLVWNLTHPTESKADLQKRGTLVEGRLYKTGKYKRVDWISYGFTVGESLVSIEERPVADLDGLTLLAPISVWYDPADPRKCVTEHEVRLEESRPGRFWLYPVLLLMMALSGYQIYAIFSPRRTGTLGD